MAQRTKSVTLKQVRTKLRADSASFRNGVFTVRDGFFYRNGRTEQHLVDDVKRAFPTARILDSGEVWKPFRGGASVANSSHWFVKFTVPEPEPEPEPELTGYEEHLRDEGTREDYMREAYGDPCSCGALRYGGDCPNCYDPNYEEGEVSAAFDAASRAFDNDEAERKEGGR